jgi:translation initiation factor IF-2
MEQLRVVDLARTMGISPTELIFKLRSIGVSVSSEEDALDLSTVRSIITGETLQKRPREVIVRSEAAEDEAPTTTARDRMVRRRRQVVDTDKEIREFEAVPSEEVDETTDVEAAPEVEAVTEVELEVAEVTEVAEAEAEEALQPAKVDAEAIHQGVTPEAVEEAEEGEVKPEVDITEEELTAAREQEEEPTRFRPIRARTPLEQSLRELSPDEIKEHLVAQKEAEERSKDAPATGGRKAKAAADAQEIRELLNKFEEQKLKGQQEAGAPATRPAPRPAPSRPGKKGRRRQQQEPRPAPPRPSRTIQFRDGVKPEGPIILSEMVTARELAEKLNVTAKELLGLLIQKGVMVTTNQALPHELAEEICSDLEVEAMVASAEDLMEYEREESQDTMGPAVPRPPVVTVMGHVDHGKTSLLDAIRSSRVAEHEAGGITQHIGASKIETADKRPVVFVDTPGHEAFTQMRARGAQVTDIVVLVVAADDGVMPQTEEAINHARAANVPLIVAINKIDKANATPDRVKQQLAERELLVEDWGGEVPSVDVSAKAGTGIDDLLEVILLVAELKELRAADEGPARGVVLEARKEKGRGIVATVIVQQGTLAVGDFFFCGSTWGRVRAITDDQGRRVEQAGPSDPVEIMGFDDVPDAGDVLQGTESEAKALEVANYRSQREKEEGLAANRKVSLDTLFDHIAEGETKELNVVIKADVQGSVEVLKEALSALSTEKVKMNALHGSVGAITTNDVMLAAASNAIIIGFSVRPERTARDLAETEQVDIRLYTVIYELIDDVKKAMVGLLEPIYREEELGHAEVREVFRIPKIGAIAGSHVVDGIITRNARARLLRDHVVIYEGQVASLKRFKDDAAEVREGFDCGIGLDKYQDIKEGDIIEAYKMVEMTPEL